MNKELQTHTSSFYLGEFLFNAFGQIKKKKQQQKKFIHYYHLRKDFFK